MREERTNAQDLRQRALAESDAICGSLRERLLSGTLPPDEAYWWTRIALWDVIALGAEPAAAETCTSVTGAD